MENVSVILLGAGLFVLSLAVALTIAGVKAFVDGKRHELLVHVRERYVIKNPIRFRSWVNSLSWLEAKRNLKLLDGRHIFEHLEGILLAR